MNIAKIIITLFKRNLAKQIKIAKQLEYSSKSSIKKEQEKKFLKLIEHARLNVPYYSDKLDNISSINDIENINLLTKEDILKNTDELKALNIQNERFFPDATSGSTGVSLYYFRDSKNHYRKAVGYRCDSRSGYKIGAKALYLWGADRDIIDNKSF